LEDPLIGTPKRIFFGKFLDILGKIGPRNAPSDILHSAFNRTPYTILIATLLSLRTKDETTARVSKELFKVAETPEKMVEIPLDRLEEIVKPTGMYRRKARTI